MDKPCLECGEQLKGRIDKKFCSDLCRNAYNNKLKAENNSYVKNINAVLRKNRKILEEFIPQQTAMSTRAKLLQKGFDFQFYTNTFTNQKGTYFFCYEYGYLPIEQESYLLVKKKESSTSSE
jgi:hypothetical protein